MSKNYEFGYNKSLPASVTQLEVTSFAGEKTTENYALKDDVNLLKNVDGKLLYIDSSGDRIYISSPDSHTIAISTDGTLATIKFN